MTTKDGPFTGREWLHLSMLLILWVFWEVVWVWAFPQFGGTTRYGITLRAFFLLPWSFLYALFFWALLFARNTTTAQQHNKAVVNGQARGR